MPRPRSPSRRRIIDSARTLLCQQGYQGTGLAEIIQASGAPRGSVYFLFPGGKEQIAVEAVTAATAEFDELITAALDATDSLPDWLHSLAEHFASSLEATGYREGCPITTITLDSVPRSQPLADACRAAYRAWQASIGHGLIRHGVPASAADDLALFVLSSLEGAMILCRAYRSTVPLTEAERHVLTILGAVSRPSAEST